MAYLAYFWQHFQYTFCLCTSVVLDFPLISRGFFFSLSLLYSLPSWFHLFPRLPLINCIRSCYFPPQILWQVKIRPSICLLGTIGVVTFFTESSQGPHWLDKHGLIGDNEEGGLCLIGFRRVILVNKFRKTLSKYIFYLCRVSCILIWVYSSGGSDPNLNFQNYSDSKKRCPGGPQSRKSFNIICAYFTL